jgi:hypothetical protein
MDTSRTSKPSCANGSCADAHYLLFQALGDGNYHGKAANLYNWEVANTYASSTGAVMEGPGTGNYFTYDDGTFATIALWLGNITNANHPGDWVQNHWGIQMQTFGDGSDGGGFNGICLRGLARTQYNVPFLQSVCDNAWGCRNSSGLTDCYWGGRTDELTSRFAWDTCSHVVGMLCLPVLKVTSATYKPTDGSNGGNNVTAILDHDVNNLLGALGVGVTNSSMGGDPALNHAKQLVASCSIGGNIETFTVPENGTINVMTVAGTVVSATYLPVDGSNGGINVASKFTGSVRGVTINNTTMGGDPAPNHAKELKMVYSVGGRQETVVVLENSVLNL